MISASAIIIEEYDTDDRIVLDTEGENINVALIKDYFNEKSKEISATINTSIEESTTKLVNEGKEIADVFYVKLGFSVITICLFLFNIFFGEKLIVEGIFNNG